MGHRKKRPRKKHLSSATLPTVISIDWIRTIANGIVLSLPEELRACFPYHAINLLMVSIFLPFSILNLLVLIENGALQTSKLYIGHP